MIERFDEYLTDIEATTALKERVSRALAWYDRVVGRPTEAIHVSEQTGEDGSRVYEALWIFSKGGASELPLVGNDIAIDEVAVGDLVRWELKARDYDFGEPTPAARCTLELYFRGEQFGTMRASGRNCRWLVGLIRDRFSQSLTSPTEQVGD